MTTILFICICRLGYIYIYICCVQRQRSLLSGIVSLKCGSSLNEVSDCTSSHGFRWSLLQSQHLSRRPLRSRAAGRRRRCAVKREPRGSRGSPRQRHAANLRPQGPEKRSKTPNRRRFTAVGGAVLSRSVGGAKHPSDGAAELITHWAEVRGWFHSFIVRYLLVRR